MSGGPLHHSNTHTRLLAASPLPCSFPTFPNVPQCCFFFLQRSVSLQVGNTPLIYPDLKNSACASSCRCSEDLKLPGEEVAAKNRACYNVEFTFDADTQVAITIYYQAIEEFHNGVPV